MSKVQPYISLVVTARNDDHGGNLLGRMQIFINGWIAHVPAIQSCFRTDHRGVEPAGRPAALAGGFAAGRKTSAPCRVRFIEVPAEAASSLTRHADALPLYQMIAKNVGIRRARGNLSSPPISTFCSLMS